MHQDPDLTGLRNGGFCRLNKSQVVTCWRVLAEGVENRWTPDFSIKSHREIFPQDSWHK